MDCRAPVRSGSPVREVIRLVPWHVSESPRQLYAGLSRFPTKPPLRVNDHFGSSFFHVPTPNPQRPIFPGADIRHAENGHYSMNGRVTSGSGQRVRKVSWRYIAQARLSPLSFTRAWHGTALSSSMIGTFPREPRTASRQVYSQLQRNLLDERYIHEVTASGDVSGFFTVSERANPERRDRYARALRS